MNAIRASHVSQFLVAASYGPLVSSGKPSLPSYSNAGSPPPPRPDASPLSQFSKNISANTGSDESEPKLETEHQQVFIGCLVSLVEYVKFSGSDILGIKVGHTARPS